jgi:hypothetical protein
MASVSGADAAAEVAQVTCAICKQERSLDDCSVNKYNSRREPQSYKCFSCNLAAKAIKAVGCSFQSDEERKAFFADAAGKNLDELRQNAESITTRSSATESTQAKRQQHPAFCKTDLEALSRFQGEEGRAALDHLMEHGVSFVCASTGQTMYELPEYMRVSEDLDKESTTAVDKVTGHKKIKRAAPKGAAKAKAKAKPKTLPKPLATKLTALTESAARARYEAAQTLAVAGEASFKEYVPSHYIEKLTAVDQSVGEWSTAMKNALEATEPDKIAASKLVTDSKEDFEDHKMLMWKVTGSEGQNNGRGAPLAVPVCKFRKSMFDGFP